MIVRARARFPLLDQWAVPLVLITTFVIVDAERLLKTLHLGTLAVDYEVYRTAVGIWLAGGDPWSVATLGYFYAGPPPSLIPYAPGLLLPSPLGEWAYAVAMLLAAWATVRALRLPLWWVLFPPLFDGLLYLNGDVLVIWLLVSGRRFAALSVVVKVYAIVPLVIHRRWGAVSAATALMIVMLPAWAPYLQGLPAIEEHLRAQAGGGLSAWGTLLFVPTVAALGLLGPRMAGWLAVPAIWPDTQLHYSAIALPAAGRSAVAAFLLAFDNPLLPAVAVLATAAVHAVAGRRNPRPLPDEPLSSI